MTSFLFSLCPLQSYNWGLESPPQSINNSTTPQMLSSLRASLPQLPSQLPFLLRIIPTKSTPTHSHVRPRPATLSPLFFVLPNLISLPHQPFLSLHSDSLQPSIQDAFPFIFPFSNFAIPFLFSFKSRPSFRFKSSFGVRIRTKREKL